MTDARNRRAHTRWKMRADVVCRIYDKPIEAVCENISAGGIFLRTAHTDALPLGTMLTVAFSDSQAARSDQPILVYGRVVQQRSGENAGVGLQWERAVTAGDPEELAALLRSNFNVLWPQVTEEGKGTPARRTSHRFEAGRRPGAVIHVRADQARTGQQTASKRPRRSSRGGEHAIPMPASATAEIGNTPDKDLRRDDVFGGRGDALRSTTGRRRSGEQTAISVPPLLLTALHGRSPTIARLPARLDFGELQCRAAIVRLGNGRLMVESAALPNCDHTAPQRWRKQVCA